MKAIQPDYRITDAEGTPLYHCTPCAKHLPADQFFESFIRGRKRKCKCCHKKETPKKSLEGKLLHAIRMRLRRRGEKKLARAWEISDIMALIKAHGGLQEGVALRIVPKAKGLVNLTPHNCVIVPKVLK